VFICVGPATLAALSVSLPKAIIVAGVLLAYQEFENRFLVPRVYGATLRLPAVVVLLALLVGAELWGVTGALLSLPAAAAVRVFIEYGNDVRHGRISGAAPPDQPFAPDEDQGVAATAGNLR
jgi:predicted PurR-regulated permease PerM